METFERYIEHLANREDPKTRSMLDPRTRVLVSAGINLNWVGDYVANPALEFEQVTIPVENIWFTSTNPEWNKILVEQCSCSVKVFQRLIEKNSAIREKFWQEVSFEREPILLLRAKQQGFYSVFDGMHRFVGAILENQETINAYVLINEEDHLPFCEAHVIYDLIRGFQRNARDAQGRQDLFHALRLLSRTYGNVVDLLEERFSMKHIADMDVQKIIKKVITEAKLHFMPGPCKDASNALNNKENRFV